MAKAQGTTKTFTTDRDRFIGDVMRKAGTTFSLDSKHVPKKMPLGMKEVKLTQPQKRKARAASNKANAENEVHEKAKQTAGVGNNTNDFMDTTTEGKVTTV